MDINKFTQKSQQAINESSQMAIKNANPEVNEIHLAYSLINDSNSYVSQVLKSQDIDYLSYKNEIENKIDNMPSQLGGSNIYPNQLFQRILLKSEDEAKSMIVRGFAEPVSRELPLEYAVEMNHLIDMELEGANC